jgi:hypothetical protein
MVTGSSLQTFKSVPAKLKYRRVYPRSVPCFLVKHPCLLVKRTRLGRALVKMGNPKWSESPREGSCGSLTQTHKSPFPGSHRHVDPLQLVASLCWLVFNPIFIASVSFRCKTPSTLLILNPCVTKPWHLGEHQNGWEIHGYSSPQIS